MLAAAKASSRSGQLGDVHHLLEERVVRWRGAGRPAARRGLRALGRRCPRSRPHGARGAERGPCGTRGAGCQRCCRRCSVARILAATARPPASIGPLRRYSSMIARLLSADTARSPPGRSVRWASASALARCDRIQSGGRAVRASGPRRSRRPGAEDRGSRGCPRRDSNPRPRLRSPRLHLPMGPGQAAGKDLGDGPGAGSSVVVDVAAVIPRLLAGRGPCEAGRRAGSARRWRGSTWPLVRTRRSSRRRR